MPKYRGHTAVIAVKHTDEYSAIRVLDEIETMGCKVPVGQGIRAHPSLIHSLVVHNQGDFLVREGDYIVFKDDQLFAMYGPTFEALFHKET